MAFLFKMWMFLLVATGARIAALSDLNEFCTSDDECVHPTLKLACDGFFKTCLIQQAASCDNGFGGMCVSGATCDSSANVCTCGGAYTLAGGKCTLGADKWAGACTATNGQACGSTVGTKCTDTLCTCASNKKVALGTGACSVAIAAKKVGYGCTALNQDTNCGTAENLECSADSVCACKEGYTGVTLGGDCNAVAAGQVGHSCETHANCDGATMQCSGSSPDKRCACKTNYFGFAGSPACTPSKNKIGGGCSGTGKGSCGDNNALCTDTPKKCQCKDGYIQTAGDELTCGKVPTEKVGRICETEPDANNCGDKTKLHLVCTDNLCACEDGWTGQKAGDCVVAPRKAGRVCSADSNPTADTACGDASQTNLECTASTCSCKTGYTGAVGETCKVAPLRVGRTCSANSNPTAKTACGDASETHLECTGTTCSCKTGYTGTVGQKCSGAVGLGASLMVLLAAIYMAFMLH